jgi:hypothetical protein
MVKVATLSLLMLTCVGRESLSEPNSRQVKRARPPQWSNDVRDIFFHDAREKLVGPRPDNNRSMGGASVASAAASTASDLETAPSGATWSTLIDAETIEAEIKRLAQAVASAVATPSKFKGGAYKDCRQHFSVLAVLFAVAAEYDGAVRWSDFAPTLRDSFARAGYNCKVGTDQTYREASQRNQDLADLIRGSRPQVSAAERISVWGQVADRAPLMQRMEIAHQEHLTKWLANERQFAQYREDILHEAQLVALFADVIGREGFEYWDDQQYAQFARELRHAAADIAAAAELENYDQAKQAIGRATNACTNCHEGYRG